MTREEADEAVAKYDCIDLYHAVKHACLHDVEPVWRARRSPAPRRGSSARRRGC